MAHLPSLAGLRLGPPTGPMAQYGKQILEPPSQETDGGKRRKGDDGLAVQVFRWVAEDGDNPICPITQLPFVPGQWVYKTPAEPPANPINYDPYALDQYWASQTPVMGFLHDTNRNLIPISEWNDPVDGLAVWVNKHPKVASPDLSPIRPDQVRSTIRSSTAQSLRKRSSRPSTKWRACFTKRRFGPVIAGAGALYGVPASVIRRSDAPRVVKHYATALRPPLRYFNPSDGDGCRITHTAHAVTHVVWNSRRLALYERFKDLSDSQDEYGNIMVPGSKIDSLHIEDVFLRELCFNSDGVYTDAHAKIYNDENEWKGSVSSSASKTSRSASFIGLITGCRSQYGFPPR